MRSARKRRCGASWIVPVLWLGAGCVDPEVRAERLGALHAEHRERMEQLERLEARLLGAEAIRAEWTELRERHGRVTEVACENLGEHTEAIAKHERRQKERSRQFRARRLAMAEQKAEPPATGRGLGQAPGGLGEGGPAE